MARDYKALREERMQTVDPAYRQVIDNWPNLRAWGVEGFRAAGEQAPRAPLADGVTARNIEVSGPNGPVPTRIFTPEVDHDGPLGVFVHIHGGGYIGLGGLDLIDGLNSDWAKSIPCALVYPDFRLPPEHKFPSSLEDCWAVVQWVGEHAEAEGWDPQRIAVGGGCTGGSLATVMAIMARDAGAPKIAFQYLQVPILDLRCDTESHYEVGEGYSLTHDDNLFVIEQYVGEPEDRWDWRASPLLTPSLRGVAPALIITGEWDPLRDEGRMYADRLRDAGVDVTYHCFEGVGHAFSPAAAEKAIAETKDALRAHIG